MWLEQLKIMHVALKHTTYNTSLNPFYQASMTAMCVGLAYGWCSPILPQLLKPESIIPMTPDQSSWVVVSIELGSLFTGLPAGMVVNTFGRKNALLFCSPILVLSWIVIIFTRSVPMLYISKLLQGACMGIVFCILPIYVTEISQPNVRGIISSLIATMWYIGIVLSYTIGSYLSYDNAAYISLTFSALYVIPLYFQPESPYYYVITKQTKQAMKSLSYFRNADPLKLNEEIKSVEEYVNQEKQNKTSLLSLFQDPISLRCLFIMEIICGTTFFTGLSVMYAYSSQIFSKTSEVLFSAEQCSIIISVLFLCMNLVATVLIDKTGRRMLALISCFGCFVSSLLAAVFFYINSETDIDVSSLYWFPVVVVGSYCISVSVGLCPLTTAFQGEVFPANTRSVASGFVSFSISIMSSTSLKMYYLIDTFIGFYFNYVVFTFFAGLGGVLLYFYMPETKNMTLAQVQRDLNKRCKKVDSEEVISDVTLSTKRNREEVN